MAVCREVQASSLIFRIYFLPKAGLCQVVSTLVVMWDSGGCPDARPCSIPMSQEDTNTSCGNIVRLGLHIIIHTCKRITIIIITS